MKENFYKLFCNTCESWHDVEYDECLLHMIEEKDNVKAERDALREAIKEALDAMVLYEMDADEEPPYKHCAMMDRIRKALGEEEA